MKKKLLLLGLLGLFVIGGCAAFQQQVQETTPPETTETSQKPAMTYYTDPYSEITGKDSSIQSTYITNRFNGLNHFYIDHQKILWGTGKNHYWQLGIPDDNDRNNLDAHYSTPVKIAEDVIHVDASDNGYFVIYLTEDHKLYGMGANTEGILRQPVKEFEDLNYHQNIYAEPVLLMENVLFASAGRESLTVLTSDFNVWWWGKFKSATAVNKVSTMVSTEPRLMVKNARYTVCGSDMAAAIDRNNNLWTWGNNVWGQCGIPYEKDYIKEARQASSDVSMVWPDMLSSKQNVIPNDSLPDINPYESIIYPYTTFIRKTNGNLYACGINLGTEDKTVAVYGGIYAPEQENNSGYTFKYSSDFVEIDAMPIEKSDSGLLPSPATQTLDEAIAGAILEHNNDKYPANYEACGEGHIIMDTKQHGNIITIYALTMYGAYQFQDGNFVKDSGSGVIPAVIQLREDSNGVWELEGYDEPLDGSLYGDSIHSMFPEDLWDRCITTRQEDQEELKRQEQSYAEAYLKTINREAAVGDYSDFPHTIPSEVGISTAVSNKIDEARKYGIGPLAYAPFWFGTIEQVENGVRYLYEHKYDAEKNEILFSKIMYDTKEIIEQVIFDSNTGEQKT